MKIKKLYEADEAEFEYELDDDGFQKTPSGQQKSNNRNNVSSDELLKKIASDVNKKGSNFYGTIYQNIRNLISLWQKGK